MGEVVVVVVVYYIMGGRHEMIDLIPPHSHPFLVFTHLVSLMTGGESSHRLIPRSRR